MKKFNYYLAALALSLGSAATLTSCIDTEEPDSIKDLRLAKAGYINADAAYRNAEIAVVQADAALKNAEAKLKEFEALAKEIANKKDESDLAVTQATNNVTLENQKAALIAAEEATKAAIIKAKTDYQKALMQNADEIASLATDTTSAAKNLTQAYNTYFGTYKEGYQDGTVMALANAQDTLVQKNLDLAYALAEKQVKTEAQYKNAVSVSELNVTLKENALAKTKEIFDSKEVNDWIKEYNDLEDQNAKLVIDSSSISVEKANLATKEIDLGKKYLELGFVEIEKELDNFLHEEELYAFDVNNTFLQDKFASFTSSSNFKFKDNQIISNDGSKNILIDNQDIVDNNDIFKDVLDFLESYTSAQDIATNEADIKQLRIDEANELTTLSDKTSGSEGDLTKYQNALKAYNSAKNDELASKRADLESASANLYGSIFLKEPTVAELDKLYDEGNLTGSYYTYYHNKKQADELVNKNNGYKEAQALTATIKGIVSDVVAKNDELNNKLSALEESAEYKELEKQMEEARAEYLKLEDDIDLIAAEIRINKEIQSSLVNVLDAAVKGIKAYTIEDGKLKVSTDDIDLLDENVEVEELKVLTALQNEIVEAQADLEFAKKQLELYQKGEYEAILDAAVKKAQDAVRKAEINVEKAEARNEAAKANYEALKAAYEAAKKSLTE